MQAMRQNLGEPAEMQTRHFDDSGHEVLGERSTAGRIVDVTDEQGQAEKDAQYEERMEEEYAKREGGA